MADQISLLSREWGWVCLAGPGVGGVGEAAWGPGSPSPSRLTRVLPSSFAEQLVLYLKVAELLSSGLQTAIDQIRAGKLCLSSTVKQGECWRPETGHVRVREGRGNPWTERPGGDGWEGVTWEQQGWGGGAGRWDDGSPGGGLS